MVNKKLHFQIVTMPLLVPCYQCLTDIVIFVHVW